MTVTPTLDEKTRRHRARRAAERLGMKVVKPKGQAYLLVESDGTVTDGQTLDQIEEALGLEVGVVRRRDPSEPVPEPPYRPGVAELIGRHLYSGLLELKAAERLATDTRTQADLKAVVAALAVASRNLASRGPQHGRVTANRCT